VVVKTSGVAEECGSWKWNIAGSDLMGGKKMQKRQEKKKNVRNDEDELNMNEMKVNDE